MPFLATGLCKYPGRHGLCRKPHLQGKAADSIFGQPGGLTVLLFHIACSAYAGLRHPLARSQGDCHLLSGGLMSAEQAAADDTSRAPDCVVELSMELLGFCNCKSAVPG